MISAPGVERLGKQLLPIFLCSVLSVTAFAESPNAVIEEAATLLDEAVSGRRNELAADKEALYVLIDEILLPRFDRKYAAQRVLARHWKTASSEERERFINAFYNNLMRLYAEAVLEFDLDRMEVLPYRGDETKKRTTVKTTMRLDNGTKVPVSYAVVKRDAGWLIYDVAIEGISFGRNFREELNNEIQAKGLSGVIERLEASESESESAAE